MAGPAWVLFYFTKIKLNYAQYPSFYLLYFIAQWYSASGTTITDLDEMAGNGVVHVVGSVLFPPLGDLYSTVKWTPALQTAFTLLQSLVDEEPDLFTDTSIHNLFISRLKKLLTSIKTFFFKLYNRFDCLFSCRQPRIECLVNEINHIGAERYYQDINIIDI